MAEKPGVISGVVRDPRDKPVANARVYFTEGPVPLPEIAALTDDRGTFSLTAPAAGTYKIACAADGFATQKTTVIVKSGQEVKPEIRLKK